MRGKILALLAGTAVVLGITVAPAPSATAAANAANFNAGDIISDALFYDGAAMTSAQIQAFLDKQIGKCSSSDCINVLRTNISSRAARVSDTTGNIVCNAFTGGTNLLVSEVIYRSQVACGISAKVILATLQKEQGLVTSKDPSPHNLNYAMGQACPDTAPCDPAFKGVGVQILAGTTQLKTYKAARFGRQPGTHNILYNPSSSCGTKRVEVKNYATAALYNYTPYTPNAAALEKLYGTGNSCSSYGNRNFWRDYTDWFGSTHGTVAGVAAVDTVTHLLALDAASGQLWAYPANGKGGWLPRVRLAESMTGVSRLIGAGDMNGDAYRDIITVDAAGKAKRYFGDGSLGFSSPQNLDVDWSGAKLLTDAGDFSGDAQPDVMTTNAAGDLLLWRGSGSGSFGKPIRIGIGWGDFDLLAAGTDFSGDGLLDVIARRTDGRLYLYRGNGRGGWLGSQQIGNGWDVMAGVYLPGDFNGDGIPDVLAKEKSGIIWLYPGNGKGAFKARTKIGTGWAGLMTADAGPRAGSKRTFFAGAGDVDGDGHRDIVGTTSTGVVRLYRGNSKGTIAGLVATPTTIPLGSRPVAMGDFNEDAIADLGYIAPGGAFFYLKGDGAGSYEAPVQIGSGWGNMTAVIGGIDFDGDRLIDVIARDTTGKLLLYRGNGRGGWASDGTQIGQGWNGMTAIFPVGDFDGDRNPDIAARRSDGILMLYPSNGVGGWKAAKQIGKGWNGMTAIFSPGNFDRVGGPDIVARRSDGALVLYKGGGKGAFSGSAVIGQGWNGMTWIG